MSVVITDVCPEHPVRRSMQVNIDIMKQDRNLIFFLRIERVSETGIEAHRMMHFYS